MTVQRILLAAVAGVIFGSGLMVSGMARPAVVLGFLDPLGAWNPALAFVMIGAIPPAAVGFWLARRRGSAVFEPRLHFPSRKDIDARLMVGAAIFGIGWGVAGLCPAPALTLLPRAPLAGAVFVAAMAAGLLLASRLRRPKRCDGGVAATKPFAGVSSR